MPTLCTPCQLRLSILERQQRKFYRLAGSSYAQRIGFTGPTTDRPNAHDHHDCRRRAHRPPALPFDGIPVHQGSAISV